MSLNPILTANKETKKTTLWLIKMYRRNIFINDFVKTNEFITDKFPNCKDFIGFKYDLVNIKPILSFINSSIKSNF